MRKTVAAAGLRSTIIPWLALIFSWVLSAPWVLLAAPDIQAPDMEPAWAPDGRRIASEPSREGIRHIYGETSQTTQPAQQTTAQNPIPDTLEDQPYSNAQHGLKIHAPKGWRVDESGLSGTHVVLYNPQIDQEDANPFAANINVISESTQGLSLDDYVDSQEKLSSIILRNYKSTEDKRVSVNGMQVRIVGGTFIHDEFHLSTLQLIVIKGGQAYIVTGTVLESTWDKYASLIEASLLTFELN